MGQGFFVGKKSWGGGPTESTSPPLNHRSNERPGALAHLENKTTNKDLSRPKQSDSRCRENGVNSNPRGADKGEGTAISVTTSFVGTSVGNQAWVRGGKNNAKGKCGHTSWLSQNCKFRKAYSQHPNLGRAGHSRKDSSFRNITYSQIYQRLGGKGTSMCKRRNAAQPNEGGSGFVCDLGDT